MFKFLLLLISFMLIIAVACTPTTAEQTAPQNTESEEMHEDEQTKEEHNEDEHDEHSNDEYEDEHDEHKDEGYRDHDTHEHGAAELMIAWSGNELAIDLHTPAYNVLGFEYAPTSNEDQAVFKDSINTLETGELFQFNDQADCTVISASVETDLAEEKHEEEEEHGEHKDEEAEEHEEEVHSDIAVSYNIQCTHPDKLKLLDASKLFTQFLNFEDLRVQWISDVEQSAKELSADDPVLTLK